MSTVLLIATVAFTRGWGGAVFRHEEFVWLHAKNLRKCLEAINRHAVFAPLDGADVSAMQVRSMRKLLLRKPALEPPRSEFHGKNVSNAHSR